MTNEQDWLIELIKPVLDEYHWTKICALRKIKDIPILSKEEIIAQAIRQEIEKREQPITEIYEKFKDSNLGFCHYKEGQAEEFVKLLWDAVKQVKEKLL